MIFMSGYCLLLINYCSIYINKMEIAFVIQIVQIGQYATKSTNADFSRIDRLDPADIGVLDSL